MCVNLCVCEYVCVCDECVCDECVCESVCVCVNLCVCVSVCVCVFSSVCPYADADAEGCHHVAVGLDAHSLEFCPHALLSPLSPVYVRMYI